MANLKYKHTAYTSAQWASLNPVIVENEIVIESDTKRTKIGNGISTYNQLEYADANSVGNSLGSIKPTDAAPTPARNGNYTFSIGGNKPAWLTAEAGVTTVKAGDGVSVVYDGVSAYTYTHVNVSSEFVSMNQINTKYGNVLGVPIYQLEIGTYYCDSNTYLDSLKTRIRFKKDTSLTLKAGSVIKLTDYTVAKLRVTYFVNGTWIGTASGWLTSDYVCPVDADYRISIMSNPEVVQTDVNILGNLLVFIMAGSHEERIKKVEENSHPIDTYLVNKSNEPTCDNSIWVTKTLFEATVDCVVDITFILSVDCYIRDQYKANGTTYTTFELRRKKADGTSVTLINNISINALSNLTKTVKVSMLEGDSIIYGDRIVGTYTTIQAVYTKSVPEIIDDILIDIAKLPALRSDIDNLLVEVIPDERPEKLTFVNPQNYKQKRFCLAHFSDIHNSIDGLIKINEYCNANSYYLNDILFTGDYGFAWEQDLSWWEAKNTANILGCIGNHEIQTYIDGVLTGAEKTSRIGLDAYNKFIKPYINNWGTIGKTSVVDGLLVYSGDNPVNANIFQPTDADTVGCSFYFKDYSVGVRLIVLDWTNYNTPQQTWLRATLEDARTKSISVIVASHFPSKGIQKSYNTFDAFYSSAVADDTAWLNVFSEYTAHIDIQNFIDAGGKFVCWLCGHYHRDNFGHLVGYPNQVCITVDSSNPSAYETDLYRAGDTVLNLFSVDLTQNCFYLLRLGARNSMYGGQRTALAWDYINHKLIREVN